MESDGSELLPLPAELRSILTQPEDLKDEHAMICLRQFLHQACNQHNIEVGAALDNSGIASWEERTEKLLRVASALSLTLLCEHWQKQECVNQSVYAVRRLSSLSAEERKPSLTPLHQNMCAHCFYLLGKDIGQEPYADRPLLHDGRECSVHQQPPGIWLFSPQALSSSPTGLPFI